MSYFQCYNFYRGLSIFSAHCKLIAATTTAPLCTNTEKCTSPLIFQLRGTESRNKRGWRKWPQIHIGHKFYKNHLAYSETYLLDSEFFRFVSDLKNKKNSLTLVLICRMKNWCFFMKVYNQKVERVRSTTKPKLMQDRERRARELDYLPSLNLSPQMPSSGGNNRGICLGQFWDGGTLCRICDNKGTDEDNSPKCPRVTLPNTFLTSTIIRKWKQINKTFL